MHVPFHIHEEMNLHGKFSEVGLARPKDKNAHALLLDTAKFPFFRVEQFCFPYSCI